jgi:hypothetical protein
MIAEIYGKISSTGSNLSNRLEDQLTGNVFGTLRYLHPNKALIPFLSKAISNKNGIISRLALPEISIDTLQVDFWTRDYPGNEPDIRISYTDHDGKNVVIIIEVKYRSGLSSDDVDKECITNIDESNNQLLKQIKSLRNNHKTERKIQIYLTQDAAIPLDTVEYVNRILIKDKIDDVEFYWLSWHDLTEILEISIEKETSNCERTILKDLICLCKDKKGFGRFTGIEFSTHSSSWNYKNPLLHFDYQKPHWKFDNLIIKARYTSQWSCFKRKYISLSSHKKIWQFTTKGDLK